MAITTQLTDFVRNTRLPKVIDNVSVLSPIWMDLWKNRKPAGGENIEGAIRYRGHKRTMAWGEFSEAPVVKRDVLTVPYVPIKDMAEPVDVSINRMQKIKSGASGATMLVNYLNEQSQAGEDSILEHLSESLFSAGTDSVNEYGQPLCNLTGLQAIIS